MGIIYFTGWYTPELCEEHPNMLFVFGDNLQRFGMGGQAVIRTCNNVYGVATKRKPSMAESAFFSDAIDTDLDEVLEDIKGLWDHLRADQYYDVVIPVTKDGKVSLGLERAELQKRAPHIYNTIVMHIEEMAKVYGAVATDTL